MCHILFGFISSSGTSRQRLFYEFFYLKACEESGKGIVIAEKVERYLKSMYQVLLRFFVLKVEIEFRELIRNK